MTPDNLPPPDRSSYVQPKRGGNPFPAIIVVAVISVLFFLARNWSALNSNYQAHSQEADRPEIAELHAGVTIDRSEDDPIVSVTNNDSYAWDHVVIDVNTETFSGQHRAKSDNVAPGSTVSFKASQVKIRNGIFTDVAVYTIKPDGTKTGEWEGTLSSR